MRPEPAIDNFADEMQLEHCNSYILRQLEIRKNSAATRDLPPPGPAITISHQTGAGEHGIAMQLSAILHSAQPKGTAPWTVFDRRLVERVLEERHMFQSLTDLTPENRRSQFKRILEEWLGSRPSSWMILPQVAEAVMHLADTGYVILLGQGANFITAHLSNVFHVRLIAALPSRIERLQRLNGVSLKEATRFVAASDRGRGRYAKEHFHVCVEDDLQYHLVVNTDRIPCPDAAQLVADGARLCFRNGAGSERRRSQDRDFPPC